jgi:hypothetical protein
VPFAFKITPLHEPHGKHDLPLLWIHAYRCVAWQQTSYSSVLLLSADRIENSFLSIVACSRVYRAVAWQRVDQIRYNILIIQNNPITRKLFDFHRNTRRRRG